MTVIVKNAVTKFRGALNKLTQLNVDAISVEINALQLEKESDVNQCAQIIVGKALSEPQYQHLHSCVLSTCKVLLPETLKAISAFDDDEMLPHLFRFLCSLRGKGLVSAKHMREFLEDIMCSSSETVVSCLDVAFEFQTILPHCFYADLLRHARRIASECDGLRNYFKVDPDAEAEREKDQQLSSSDDEDNCCSFVRQRVTLPCTVYVSNIDCAASEWDLSVALRSIGEVNKVRLCGNSRQATQYAFVEFSSEEAAQKAIKIDGKRLLGQYALRWSLSKSIIQDSSPDDALFGKHGQEKACTFGLNSDLSPKCVPLRNLVCLQQQQSR